VLVDHQRRQALLDAKLRALIRRHWGEGTGDRRPGQFPGGATLAEGTTGWVLAEDDPIRAVGGSLIWADRLGLDEVHVLAAADAGIVARRAAQFAFPITVWSIAGIDVAPAVPAPVPAEPPLAPDASAAADVLRHAGIDAVVEHGVLMGEYLGLEVARFVDGRLEVGVGKHDREAHALVHADLPLDTALARVVAAVQRQRHGAGEPHPLRRLQSERWLRAVVIAHPDLVGATHLLPVPSPVVREDLRKPAMAPAAGEGVDGGPVLVCCSVGIDLDLVPAAADARVADGRRPRLVLAVPARDEHPTTRMLAGRLREPADVVPVPDDWRERTA
jgi:hypothetical protein